MNATLVCLQTPFRRFLPPSDAFRRQFRRGFRRLKSPSDAFRRTLHTLPPYPPVRLKARTAPVRAPRAVRHYRPNASFLAYQSGDKHETELWPKVGDGVNR